MYYIGTTMAYLTYINYFILSMYIKYAMVRHSIYIYIYIYDIGAHKTRTLDFLSAKSSLNRVPNSQPQV